MAVVTLQNSKIFRDMRSGLAAETMDGRKNVWRLAIAVEIKKLISYVASL